MEQQGWTTAVVSDPSGLLGRLAGMLAAGESLGRVLDALADGLGLRTAVLRSSSGELLAVGGEALHAVPQMREVAHVPPTLELPVAGRGALAALTVVGARPSHLPVLRAAANVLGLALVPTMSAVALLEAAEEERDEAADALHDGVVQSLVVARYAADAAVRGGDATVARDAVQAALVELRRALWAGRPRGATSLTEALAQLTAQLAEADLPPLTVLGSGDATGAPAVLAYRLVQAVAGTAPVRVGLRADSRRLLLDVDVAAALPSPDRWVLRARALDGDLTSSAGRLRLVLPLTDARTAP